MSDGVVKGPPAWVKPAAALVRRLPAGRYRLIHWLCRRPPAPFFMTMRPDLGGAEYCCDLRDAITREVCFSGQYEPQETQLIRHILRPGASFVDVGANWGYFSLVAAHLVGVSGRVLSIEPDPRLFALLREAVVRNALAHVFALQAAAADASGTLTLAGFDEAGGNFGLSSMMPPPGSTTRSYEVTAEPLDDILERVDFGSVDLMKMDIEGAEARALEGLQAALTAGRVLRLLLELHPVQLEACGSSAEAVVARLRHAGYRGYRIDHSAAATRAVAYGRSTFAPGLVRPIGEEALDSWPHQLWLAPGVGSI